MGTVAAALLVLLLLLLLLERKAGQIHLAACFWESPRPCSAVIPIHLPTLRAESAILQD